MLLKSPKNLLVISPFESWPLSQGSIVRTHHLVQFLGQRHKIWYAFRGRPQQPPPSTLYNSIANTPNRFSQLFSLRFLVQLWRTIRTEDIDAILVAQIWSALHGLLLKWLTGKPFIFDNHNVEYVRFRRMGHVAWPLVALLEWAACHTADHIICVSETDKKRLVRSFRLPPHKLQVAANGADVAQIQQHPVDLAATKKRWGLATNEAMVLFFGSLNHAPNAQAAGIILDEIAPRLASQAGCLKLVIAGLGDAAYLRARQRPLPANILFTGFVNDIIALIKSADLIIVPIRSGSGTRFKIIESAACGRPIISTTLGAEGLDRAAFGGLLTICDDWDAFAQHIRHHLSQPGQYNVPAAFRATYDWQHIFDGVDWSILDG
jgi:glycosyltransferase involved in cell wall biosynthesis